MINYQIIDLPGLQFFEYETDSKYYVTTMDLIIKLTNAKFPIKNRGIAVKNILEFLKYFWHNKNKDNTLNISYKKLEEFFSSKNVHNEYLDILKEANIIAQIVNINGTIYNSGFNKVKNNKDICTKRFTLTKNYLEDKELCVVIFDNNNDYEKINNEINNLPKKFIYTIDNVSIDVQKAFLSTYNEFKNENDRIVLINDLNVNKEELTIKNYITFKHRLNCLFTFATAKRYIKKGEKVDRIYHNLCTLPSMLREHLSIKSLKFNYIDIPNCQPLLLLAFLKKNNLEYDENYYNDAVNAKLYERFLDKKYDVLIRDQINGQWTVVRDDKKYLMTNRNECKTEMYRTVFFYFNINTDMNKEFKNLYPKTWNSINEYLKNNKEITIASELQNMEAAIINKIVPNNYYFTIFDAIYFTSLTDKQLIIYSIKESFNKLGIEIKKLEFNKQKIKL